MFQRIKYHAAAFFDRHEWVAILLAAIILIGACLAVHLTCSYFEARAFYNATGKQVSAWDAMFIELRVSESTDE